VAHGPFIGVDPDYYSRAHSSQIAVKTGAGSNYCQYSNPVVDKLLEEGRTTYDRGKRKEIYWKVQRLFDEDVPFAPIFNWVFILGRNAALQGNQLNYYVENTWDIQNWYWE
jgi:peptide/nickel transport system substrate-binding protein